MGIRKAVKRKWRLYRMGEFSEQEIICCNGSQVLDRLVFHTDVSVGEHEPHSSSPFKLLGKKKKKKASLSTLNSLCLFVLFKLTIWCRAPHLDR